MLAIDPYSNEERLKKVKGKVSSKVRSFSRGNNNNKKETI
jgi:hypothetical protein